MAATSMALQVVADIPDLSLTCTIKTYQPADGLVILTRPARTPPRMPPTSKKVERVAAARASSPPVEEM